MNLTGSTLTLNNVFYIETEQPFFPQPCHSALCRSFSHVSLLCPNFCYKKKEVSSNLGPQGVIWVVLFSCFDQRRADMGLEFARSPVGEPLLRRSARRTNCPHNAIKTSPYGDTNHIYNPLHFWLHTV